ncbi:MAG: dicarboxylate/amino acid:cation symporter [Clostridia bacterium]|nr:dicarboxylate/amino acid:cation symporter [Clostridia bacterium]
MKKVKVSLGLAILISLVLGIVAGIILQNNGDFTTAYLKPFGTIYINLLKLLVVPIVLFSIIDGVVSLGSVKKVGSIGWKTVVFFVPTTIIASIIGIFSAKIFSPSFPMLVKQTLETAYEPRTFMEELVAIFPSNWLQPLIDTDMLPTIVIALLTGFGILLTGEEGKKVANGFHSFYTVIMKMMGIILWLTPIGVFCLITDTIAVNGVQILSKLGIVLLAVYVGYIIHAVVVYGFTLIAFAKISPARFIKEMFPAMVTAFTTTSSSAALPLNMECTNRLGAKKETTSFILTLGCTVNKDGAAIYMCIIAVFIAKCYGINLSVAELVTIAATATVASIGSAAGMPGAAMIMMTVVLSSVGLPLEGVALVAGIDKLFDMGRTCLNMTGDSICALAIDRIEKRKAERKAKQN